MIAEIGKWTETDRQGRPITTRRWKFSGGQAEQVLWMRQLVRTYRATHYVRDLARRILAESRCPARDKTCHALAIARWVQDRIAYVNEGDETFQTPPRTVDLGYGDCDDHAILVATLIESIGISAEIVAMTLGSGTFKHVFARAVIPPPALGGVAAGDGKPLRIPLDTTLPAPLGTNPITLALSRGAPRVDSLVL